MATSPNIDLVRDEILTTQPRITIQVPPGVAAEGVPRAVGVIGAEGTLGPTRARGTYRWTPRAALDPGRYTLVVEPMTDRASQPVTASVEVPFTVVNIAGKIPPRLRLESFTRVRLRSGGVERLPIDATARGRFYEFVKATDRRTGKPVALAFDQDGNKVNGDKVLAEYDAAQTRRIGKIHPSLDATLRAAVRPSSSTCGSIPTSLTRAPATDPSTAATSRRPPVVPTRCGKRIRRGRGLSPSACRRGPR